MTSFDKIGQARTRPKCELSMRIKNRSDKSGQGFKSELSMRKKYPFTVKPRTTYDKL